jgi:N-acetylglucosamine kinase-like BadF-type ATPase
MYFLGIDAGASATQWVLHDGTQVVKRGAAGPIDGHINRDESRQRMQSTLAEIARESSSTIDSIVIGITGVAEIKADHDATVAIINSVFPKAKVELLSDIHLAYRVYFKESSGVLLYAGTGAVACTGVKGELVRVGGWGYLLGDEGAGFWIGREAIRALMIYIDKLEAPPAGSLEAAVAQALHATNWADVKNFVYGKNRSEIAALARLVFSHSDQAVAQKILVDAADHLIALVARVDEITGDTSRPITFTGGTSRGTGPLNDRLTDYFAGRITIAHHDIAEGAADLARGASSQG